ncbi:MAG: DUF1127 domain-containing protein [Pseudomonadota bacterium]
MFMDALVAPFRPLAARVAAFDTREAAGRVAGRVAVWLKVIGERRRLAAMDDRMLEDIGISRLAAEAELARPAWDITSRR